MGVPESQICILVIEDDDLMRQTLVNGLSVQGYTVIEASDGESGLSKAQEAKPDLIVTDLYMPQKDGIEIVDHLTQQAPRPKILAISGGGSKNNTTTALETADVLGADATLRKPFHLNELFTTIERCLA